MMRQWADDVPGRTGLSVSIGKIFVTVKFWARIASIQRESPPDWISRPSLTE
jgi:hypothetical protein